MMTKIDRLHSFLDNPQGKKGGQDGLRLARSLSEGYSVNPIPETLRAAEGGLLIMTEKQGAGEGVTLVCTPKDSSPGWLSLFSGEQWEAEDVRTLAAPCVPDNTPALQAALPNLSPAPLGLTPSFGFGDRIGLATSGHARAMHRHGMTLAPIFAQQSIREMSRTDRTPRQVMTEATWGAFRAGWQGSVGADADHLMTKDDVEAMAAAGFTFFTIDPSKHVDQRADDYTRAQVDEIFQMMLDKNISGTRDVLGLYAGRSFDLGLIIVQMDEPALKRAVVKYGRGLAHIYGLAEHIARTMSGRGFELEISVDETRQPTSILEHLFIALELKRHQVSIVSLAPRFIGDFEKGVDYRGDVDIFKGDLALHSVIAEQYGPYKISLHSGSDKFCVYPQLGKTTGRAFHVKTAGTSYLEALRTACRADPEFFRRIANFSLSRFETDRATYHISATLEGTPAPGDLTTDELERVYLDEDNGRQILHVTYGSVLTAKETGSQSPYLFRDQLKNLLIKYRDLHDRLVSDHLGRHLRLLCDWEDR